MTERLDRIEAILESSAQRQAATDATLDRVSEQQAQNTEGQAKNKDDIETLLGAVSTNLTSCRELRAAGAASDARIDRLTERAASNERLFETVLSEARADRQETRQLWNDAVTQIAGDRAEARAQAEADRAETRQRFDAQMEVIQRLLIELVEMNRDNRRLRDRVDGLEQRAS
ncbi:MAG: hypothetical protein ACR2FS_05015 [Phormidesmis sp.]